MLGNTNKVSSEKVGFKSFAGHFFPPIIFSFKSEEYMINEVHFG